MQFSCNVLPQIDVFDKGYQNCASHAWLFSSFFEKSAKNQGCITIT
jgi:hypothetical protein